MASDSTVKVNLDLSPENIIKLKYTPVSSSDVERRFSQYKSVLRDRLLSNTWNKFSWPIFMENDNKKCV